jgi:hypothetical protein
MQQSVFDNTVLLKTFEVVVQGRSVTLREILEALSPDEARRAEIRSDVFMSLEWLVERGLVGVEEAPVKDFCIYYVTSDGLLAWSHLKEAGVFDKNEPVFRLIAAK